MYTVGLDVDIFVFTEIYQLMFIFFNSFQVILLIITNNFVKKYYHFIDRWKKILLCAGNTCKSNPLVFITLGKIYFNIKIFCLFFKRSSQSAGNFSFSRNATATTKNTFNKLQLHILFLNLATLL